MNNELGNSSKHKLVVVTVKQLLSRPLPIRELILAPWLATQSLNMIYSWRGVGKTQVALGIAYAVATGSSFLGWKASKPRGVLYLDGEMPANALQERLSKIGYGKQNLKEENLLLLTPDLQISKMPDLASNKGQQMIDELMLPSTELIIIDNLSCFVRSGARENDAESWLKIGEWALAKRTQGKSILFIHHAGKSGNQRGTSKREDILDTVISLKHAPDYQWDDGAHFEVHFEKARHILGKSVKPFIAHLTQNGSRQKWQTMALFNKNKIIELHKTGLSNSQIACVLGINRSTVFRNLKNVKKN